MTTLSVRIHGRDYTLACEAGQEAQLLRIAGQIDERATKLAEILKPGSENLLLVLTCLTFADALDESQRRRIEAGDSGAMQEEIERYMAGVLESMAGRVESIAERVEKQYIQA